MQSDENEHTKRRQSNIGRQEVEDIKEFVNLVVTVTKEGGDI